MKNQDGIAYNYKVIGVIESSGSYANHPSVFNFTSRLFLFLKENPQHVHLGMVFVHFWPGPVVCKILEYLQWKNWPWIEGQTTFGPCVS